MIIIAGHKDLDRKMLKKVVAYQEFVVLDATDSDELEDWNVEKDNGFAPAGKLYRDDSDFFSTRSLNNKEEAIQNFFTSLDFMNSMEKVISRFVEAKGEVNIFIILKQKAYKVLGKQYQKQFLYYMKEDLSVVMLWDQIKDERLEDVLTWVPDEKTIKACNKAVKRIEYDLSQNTAIVRGKKKKKDPFDLDDDDFDDDSDIRGSSKKSIKKCINQIVAAEDFLCNRDHKGNKLYYDPLTDMERVFPDLFAHFDEAPGLGKAALMSKDKKKKKKKQKKLKDTIPWYDDDDGTMVKKKKKKNKDYTSIKFI